MIDSSQLAPYSITERIVVASCVAVAQEGERHRIHLHNGITIYEGICRTIESRNRSKLLLH